ncbi:MAG: peptide deformylase [Defluviitaleaceae bacterium]|nr:peptide deformylase [Defluviitaleaceae bacterium]
MALRTIRLEGDEILRKKSKPVAEINEKIHILLDDMLETMYAMDGVGIAAPQVGILRRVVIIDAAIAREEEGESDILELINPEIVSMEGSQINTEACLSLPGEQCHVERPEKVVVRALDRYGNMRQYEGEGFLAVAFCHEIDHLDGIIFTDKKIEGYEEKE